MTPKHKKRRIEWAKHRKNWTLSQWRTVIWSDESRFEVCVGDERKRVIRTSKEPFHKDCLKRTVKFPASLMVWGCMSGRGVGNLYFVDGLVNAVKYQHILQEQLLPSIPRLQSSEGSYIFQQDGASCHTARSTMGWLSAEGIPLMEWPSSSPDLSPIETVWHKMKQKLRQEPARTLQDLKNKITNIWQSFTAEECEKLVDTMPRRIAAVIKNKGDVTQW